MRCSTTGTDDRIASRPEGNEVTLAYVDQCAGYSLAAERLRAAIAASGLERVRVTWRPVHDIRSAEAAGFAGSPTQLINGIDPFPKSASVVGLCCRLYRTEEGLSATSSVDQLVAALRAHLRRTDDHLCATT